MPIPKPQSDETEQEFIGRCVSAISDEYEDDQALAICYQQWGNKGSRDMINRKNFTGIELKADNPGAFIARISTLNVIDKDGDVTLNGAAPEGKEILISAYQHGSWNGSLPVGKGIVHEVNNEIIVEGNFNLNTVSGKEHYEAIKFSPNLTEWSYGFKILELEEKSEWNDNPKVWRVIKKMDIFEASPVLLGAGVNTGTLSIKSDNSTFADNVESVLAAVKALVERSKSLADLRRADGRKLSKSNKERLSEVRKSLIELSGELEPLATIEPDSNKAQIQKLYIESLKLESQKYLIGVN